MIKHIFWLMGMTIFIFSLLLVMSFTVWFTGKTYWYRAFMDIEFMLNERKQIIEKELDEDSFTK
jgi:hypothetical protein